MYWTVLHYALGVDGAINENFVVERRWEPDEEGYARLREWRAGYDLGTKCEKKESQSC